MVNFLIQVGNQQQMQDAPTPSQQLEKLLEESIEIKSREGVIIYNDNVTPNDGTRLVTLKNAAYNAKTDEEEKKEAYTSLLTELNKYRNQLGDSLNKHNSNFNLAKLDKYIDVLKEWTGNDIRMGAALEGASSINLMNITTLPTTELPKPLAKAIISPDGTTITIKDSDGKINTYNIEDLKNNPDKYPGVIIPNDKKPSNHR